jgi:hypothetical protein
VSDKNGTNGQNTSLVPHEPSGGLGGIASQRNICSELALIRTAVRRGWNIPDQAKDVVPAEIVTIVIARKEDKKTPLYGARERIAAARVLAMMFGQDVNLAKLFEQIHNPKPVKGTTTVNVFQQNNTQNNTMIGRDLDSLSVEELEQLDALEDKIAGQSAEPMGS